MTKDKKSKLSYNRHIEDCGSMNHEVISHHDESKSLILKDDRDNVFAYICMQDNFPNLTLANQKPAFTADYRNSLKKALTLSDEIIGNAENNPINVVIDGQPSNLKSHMMEEQFVQTLKSIVLNINHHKKLDNALRQIETYKASID